jgi:8-oxo-dGTP pyrophosphatase MutT (NUDIX family)
MMPPHAQAPPAAGAVLPSELIQSLETVLLDVQAHPYPEIANPEGVPKRASVALIIRIQPHYSHWPSPPTTLAQSSPSADSEAEGTSPAQRVKAFFAQEWVQHGDPEVLFIKRAAREGDKWTSHVALPGGRRDPEDASDAAAAVREAWEEVGIDLSDAYAVPAGNLPQQVVSAGWGKVPYANARRSWGLMHRTWLADPALRLMVLCPYIYVVTEHAIPPLRLQPTEVASAHWVPLRALLSPKQRTFWYQDVSNRTSQRDFGMTRWFHKMSIGDMMFAAVRLIPSESVYCSSITEFLPDEPLQHEPLSLNHTAPLLGRGQTPISPVDKPLLLWGLTLGMMGDFLDMVPPYNALRAWTYPTFTTLDVRLILHLMTHRFRQERDRELDAHKVSFPSAEEQAKREGRPAARLRLDQRRSDANSVGLLLAGYYTLVRRAVLVTFLVRGAVMGLIMWGLWKRRKAGGAGVLGMVRRVWAALVGGK